MGKTEPNRNVYCLMGLPFDAITLEEAARRVRQSALSNVPCFISTPNLNFVIAARSDPQFRDSVLRSDLSLADGMPLVWVARLLGLPIRERVSGAGLFERLLADPGEPVTVYFFGGPQGAAEAACRKVNEARGGLRCVGFESPGFGDLSSISTEEHIERINRSGAQFVIVSLGAKKGQRWIEMNRHRLRAPVVCHLGAVVNFAAGTVQRAPRWIQALGGEWLWRIGQEPTLWRRYWDDGRGFLGVVLREVLPLWIGQRRRSLVPGAAGADVRLEQIGSSTRLSLSGAWDGQEIERLRTALGTARQRGDSLTVDLGQTVTIGSAVLGMLMLAKAACGEARRFEVLNANPVVSDTIARFGASFLLETRP